MFDIIVDNAEVWIENIYPIGALALLFAISFGVWRLLMRIFRVGSGDSSDVPYVPIGGLEGGVRPGKGSPGRIRVRSDAYGYASGLYRYLDRSSRSTDISSGEVSLLDDEAYDNERSAAMAYYGSVARPYLDSIRSSFGNEDVKE